MAARFAATRKPRDITAASIDQFGMSTAVDVSRSDVAIAHVLSFVANHRLGESGASVAASVLVFRAAIVRCG